MDADTRFILDDLKRQIKDVRRSAEHKEVKEAIERKQLSHLFVDIKQRQAEFNIHGGFHRFATGEALNSGNNIDANCGRGKVVIVPLTASDATGDFTIAGNAVDRDTGVETFPTEQTFTMTGSLPSFPSSTDGGGHRIWDLTGGYITSDWFTGVIQITTSDLDLTTVDLYNIAYDQWNDVHQFQIDTLDMTAFATNTAAEMFVHLYSVRVVGDLVTIASEADIDMVAAAIIADRYYRWRFGNLAVVLDGRTDGFFVDMFPDPSNQNYWEDLNFKLWSK